MTKCININTMKNELKQIFDIVPLNKNKLIEFFNKYNIKYTNDQISNIQNKCITGSTMSSNNYVGNNEQCAQSIKEICKDMYTNKDKIQECIWNINPGFSNIDQTNTAQSSSKCIINDLSKDLITNNDEIIGLAIKSAIYGLPDIDCGDVNIKINANKYYEELNKCLNETTIKQKNIIDSCTGVSNIKQSNFSNLITNCMIGKGLEITKPIIKNETAPITIDTTKPTDTTDTTNTANITNNKSGYNKLFLIGIMIIGIVISLLVLIIILLR